MALRLSFAAVVVPMLFVACGDSKSSHASASGGSPDGASAGHAGADGGEASGSSGSIGTGVASAGAGFGGVSANDSAGAGAAQSMTGGRSGSPASAGGGGTAISVGGATGGSASEAGTGSMAGGIPGGWIPVADVDYSIVPGANFETVRLMFAGSPCSGSNCHFGGRNHLLVGKPADQLYNYMMSFKTLECGKLIDTVNPSQSALVKYLRGPCGMIERMPSGKCFDDGDEMCVPEYYIQLIEQWIAKGAPR